MRWRRLFAFAVPLWLALCPPLLAADNVLVRVALNPDQGAVIGQHVRLLVDVLFPGDMPYPPRVAMPSMPGAQVFRFETQAVTMNDRIDGTDYTGKRFEFALYPRRGGELTVPPVTVTLLDRQQNETGTVVSSATRAQVVVPSGVDASQPVIASTEVTMTQQWSPAPTTQFKAGDTLRRTVTRHAADVPGLAMSAFTFPAPEGVRVYVDAPRIDDKTDRGRLTSERIDSATYVFEQPGSFALPALSQRWWDLDGKTARTITVAGITATAAASAPSVAARHEVSAARWATLATAIIALSGAVLAIWRLWPRLAEFGREMRRRQLLSEPVVFRTLVRACRTGDPAPTYHALGVWKRRLLSQRLTVREIDQALSRAAAEPLAGALEHSLFGSPGANAWSTAQGERLAVTLRLARAIMLDRRQVARHPSQLPPLNPTGSAAGS